MHYFVLSNDDEYDTIIKHIDYMFLDSKVVALKNYDELENKANNDYPALVFINAKLIDINRINRITTINKNFKIIYFGNKNLWSFDLYQTDHIDYIVTPLTKLKVRCACRKYLHLIKLEDNEVFKYKFNKVEYIVKQNEIAYINSFGKYVSLIMKDSNESLFISRLNDIENKLSSAFFRVHQSFIINMRLIKRIDTNNIIILINGAERVIPISRSRYKLFMKAYKLFWNID